MGRGTIYQRKVSTRTIHSLTSAISVASRSSILNTCQHRPLITAWIGQFFLDADHTAG